MLWFEGSVASAIAASRETNSLFVVYVYGEDDMSSEMDKTWDSSEVTKLFGESKIVAIRIKQNSQDCTHFSQYYPVVVVPSTYFIRQSGVPLEVIGGQVKAEDFVVKVHSVLQIHEGQNVDKSTGTRESTQASSSSDTSQSSLPLSEKVEKAKALIEQKRLEKEEKEKEKAKEQEKERRRLGQDLQKLRQSQQEAELKEVREQLKKDKEMERIARERVRQQIARDREERKAEYNQMREKEKREMEEKKKAKLLHQQAQAEAEEAQRSETARIQVRFPDGSSSNYSFTSAEPLQVLADRVIERLNGPVKLSTTFPKHTFTEDEMTRSFIDLRLAPSAVVIAVPARGGGSGPVQSSGGSAINMVLYPFFTLWNFIYSLLFGGGNSSSVAMQPQASTSQAGLDDLSDNTSSSSTSRPGRPDRPKTAYKRRTEGNVRRLTDMRDDDDDMTTYNGNSTQQL